MMEGAHEQAVRKAFDDIAPFFDSAFENEITRRLRRRIYEEIEKHVPESGSVLDINCGTGIDALYFRERGYHVTANDLSPAMVELARRKIEARYPDVRFTVTSFEALGEAVNSTYDLVFSNFGGLNCIQNLSGVSRQLAGLVKRRGILALVVMPPVCIWEIASGLARANLRVAFRRLRKQPSATGFGTHSFRVYYHTPSSAALAFGPWFTPVSVRALSLVSPPPHAHRVTGTSPSLYRFLWKVDEIAAPLPVLRALGDHWLMILRRQ